MKRKLTDRCLSNLFKKILYQSVWWISKDIIWHVSSCSDYLILRSWRGARKHSVEPAKRDWVDKTSSTVQVEKLCPSHPSNHFPLSFPDKSQFASSLSLWESLVDKWPKVPRKNPDETPHQPCCGSMYQFRQSRGRRHISSCHRSVAFRAPSLTHRLRSASC